MFKTCVLVGLACILLQITADDDFGDYEIHNYVFDYSELPTDGWYGVFCAKAIVLKGTEEVGCVEVHVEFTKKEDDEDE
ncbi:hypothetical protein HF086_001549 [Spodoptera exigua]|uniref:Uncharacterized protein n=1 Tax=Spodoptera exigua TaxID=7107 RepID=A0A922MSA4_SPOEX|nr:hypothetical protein HF086_001549 [Spodoptera exigua]